MNERLLGLADKLELLELQVRYAAAIDARDYDALRGIFTADAHIDVRSTGGIQGDVETFIGWLPGAMGRFEVVQHFISNLRSERLDADHFEVRTYVRAVHVYREAGQRRQFDLGGEYHDQVIRVGDVLRIANRTLIRRWMQGPLPGADERANR